MELTVEDLLTDDKRSLRSDFEARIKLLPSGLQAQIDAAFGTTSGQKVFNVLNNIATPPASPLVIYSSVFPRNSRVESISFGMLGINQLLIINQESKQF